MRNKRTVKFDGKRLLAYTTAAGVGAFMAGDAQAALQVEAVNTTISNGGSWTHGTTGTALALFSSPGGAASDSLGAFPGNAGGFGLFGVLDGPGFSYYVDPFSIGSTVNASAPLAVMSDGAANTLLAADRPNGVVFNNFGTGSSFFGFAYNNGGTRSFGYVQVQASDTGGPLNGGLQANIVGIAWDPTGAGVVVQDLASIPEPSTVGMLGLGMLAVGAAGLRARRKVS